MGHSRLVDYQITHNGTIKWDTFKILFVTLLVFSRDSSDKQWNKRLRYFFWFT